MTTATLRHDSIADSIAVDNAIIDRMSARPWVVIQSTQRGYIAALATRDGGISVADVEYENDRVHVFRNVFTTATRSRAPKPTPQIQHRAGSDARQPDAITIYGDDLMLVVPAIHTGSLDGYSIADYFDDGGVYLGDDMDGVGVLDLYDDARLMAGQAYTILEGHNPGDRDPLQKMPGLSEAEIRVS